MSTTTTTLDLPAIAAHYFAAWEAHDADAIAALHTPDSQFHAHGGGDPVCGRAHLRQEFAALFERFPGFGFDTHRVLYGDGHWVLDWTLTFLPPGAERRGFRCVDVVEVAEDGLVARKDTFVDFVELQAAMGAGS